MTPLTRDEIEEGIARLTGPLEPFNKQETMRKLIEWQLKYQRRLLQMALDSLPKEETAMKEAIEGLRGFAPDFPEESKVSTSQDDPSETIHNFEPDSARPRYCRWCGFVKEWKLHPKPTAEKVCCGNCRHFLLTACGPKTLGDCYKFQIYNIHETMLCPSHERKPDANT